ncbi:MAG: histidine kinase [Blastocatellia bacterium AA13]|nr:MAG: histidine kinase [Blastocatellia bacterium AA13]
MSQSTAQTIESIRSIDQSVLASIRSLQTEEDPNVVVELIEIYLADSVGRLAEIRRAVSLENRQVIQRAAHGLRGSSGNLGASALASLCMDLEHISDLAGAPQLLFQIETEYESVRTELELEITNDKARV